MKKILLISLIIGCILAGAYLFFYVKLKGPVNHLAPAKQKGSSPLSLEPLLIAKLERLVKDGSKGLYDLSLDGLQIDLLHSKVTLSKIRLNVDSLVLMRLDKQKKAPDDVFGFSLDTLKLTGVDVKAFLFGKKIDLDTLGITDPVIELSHQNRAYNYKERAEEKDSTLYQRIMNQVSEVSIKKIAVVHGNFIHHHPGKNSTSRYNDFTIYLADLRIDSSTQFDKNRFMYSRNSEISFHNYVYKTPDSLYIYKLASVEVNPGKHTFTAENVGVEPRGTKQQFQKKLKYRQEMYKLNIRRIELTNVDWWDLSNSESLITKKADVYDADFEIYFDRSLPASSAYEIKDFPQQFLLKAPTPVNIENIRFHNCDVSYEELNPAVHKSGKISFNSINGVATNVSNIPAQIKINGEASVTVSTKFMNKVPVKADFRFKLTKPDNGKFSADLQMGELDGSLLNSFAEPLGLIRIESATVKSAVIHLEGDNFSVQGKQTLLYENLRIIPLKKDDKNPEGVKKRGIISFLANTFVIKNANPAKNGQTRQPVYDNKRLPKETFFNLVWKSIITGILKTVGVNPKIAT